MASDPKQTKDEALNPAEQDYERKFDEQLPGYTSAYDANTRSPEQIEAQKRNLQMDELAANKPTEGTSGIQIIRKKESEPESPVHEGGMLYSPLTKNLANKAIKRWATGLIAGSLTAVIAAAFTSVIGFFINIKELAMNFFGQNQYSAYSTRTKDLQERIFNVPGENCRLSIRCRLAPGISDEDIQRYKDAGFEIDTAETPAGKKYVTELRTTVDGEEFKLNKDTFGDIYGSGNLPNLVIRGRLWATGSKPNALVWRAAEALLKYAEFNIDRSFVGDSITKIREYIFGGGKTGDALAEQNPQDETNSNAQQQQAVADNINNVSSEISTLAAQEKTAAAQGLSPEDAVDLPTDPAALNGSTDTAVAAADAAAQGAAGGVKGALEGVLTAVQYACTGYSLIRAVTIGAKIFKYAGLILFAISFMTQADALKAGKATANSIALYAGSLVRPSTLPGQEGQTAANSNLFSLVTVDKIANVASLAYGVMGFPALSFLEGAMKFFESFGANASNCKQVLSWYGQVITAVAGLIIDVFTAGGASLAGIAIGVTLGMVISGVISFVAPMLVKYLAGTVAPDLLGAGGGLAVGDALGGGLGAANDAFSRGNGLPPIPKSQAAEVFQETNVAMAQMNKIDQMGQSPFSINSPNSITSRLALALFPYVSAPTSQSSLQSFASLAVAPFSILGDALNGIFVQKVGALSTNYGGEYCTDPDILSLNIVVDAYCNPVHGLPDSILNDPQYAPTKVMDYMINNQYVNEVDGTPASTANGQAYQKFLDSCVTGTEPYTPDGQPIDVTSGSNTDTTLCLKTDQQTYMFYLFNMDKNILDGMDASSNGTLGQGNGGNMATTGATGSSNVVYYSQLDPRWSAHPYMGATIYSSGCGPTSMAMVASTLTGQSILPPTVADYFQSQNWAQNGTSWASMGAGGAVQKYGFTVTPIKDTMTAQNHYANAAQMNTVVNDLENTSKQEIIIAAGDDTSNILFTSAGHFIVLRGVDKANGNILVNDPNNFVDANGQPKPGQTTSKEWPVSYFEAHATGLWAYSK